VRTRHRWKLIGMHVLHRPHLPRAVTVTALAAVLAIVLTLTLASLLSDLASSPSSAPPRSAALPSLTAPAASHQASRRDWNLSPLSNLLSAPATEPWAQHGAFP
jgi:hypothetical protein